MYKQLAAYAAGLIARPASFTSGLGKEAPVYGITEDGEYIYTRLTRAQKLSIQGAMRAAQEALSDNIRTFNTLYYSAARLARDRFGKRLSELNHSEAVEVLLLVAR